MLSDSYVLLDQLHKLQLKSALSLLWSNVNLPFSWWSWQQPPGRDVRFLLKSVMSYKYVCIQDSYAFQPLIGMMHWVWWLIKISHFCWANHILLNKLGKIGSKVAATTCYGFIFFYMINVLYASCKIIAEPWYRRRRHILLYVVCSFCSAQCAMWRRGTWVAEGHGFNEELKKYNWEQRIVLKNISISHIFRWEWREKHSCCTWNVTVISFHPFLPWLVFCDANPSFSVVS